MQGPARTFTKEFKELLQAVFEKQSYFADFSAGGLEALDGVKHNATAFSVKTTNIPVTIGTYNKGANVGMGTGTSNSNRFGNRVEIIYTDVDVPYTDEWSYHEGVDRHTVNNGFEDAVADRLDLQAQAKTQMFDNRVGLYLSANAAKTEDLDLTNPNTNIITDLFDEVSAYYANKEAIGQKVAKVVPALWNRIINHPLTTTGKNSSANIDQNTIVYFKGFEVTQVPEAKFQTNEYAYFYIKNIGKVFTGINTSRAIESEDFDGMALQGAGKYGVWALPDNKEAIVKAKKPTTP